MSEGKKVLEFLKYAKYAKKMDQSEANADRKECEIASYTLMLRFEI